MLRLTHISAIWNAPQYLKNCHVAVRPDAGPTAIPSQQLSTAIQGSMQQIPMFEPYLNDYVQGSIPSHYCAASKLNTSLDLQLQNWTSLCSGSTGPTAGVCRLYTIYLSEWLHMSAKDLASSLLLLFFKPFFACVHGSACANFSLLMSPSFLRTKLYSEHSFKV